MRGRTIARYRPGELDLDDILRPTKVFNRPNEVVWDPNLSINEKRALLASWASDACAVASVPELRQSSAGAIVTFDEIMDALRELDEQARQGRKRTPAYKRWVKHGDLLT